LHLVGIISLLNVGIMNLHNAVTALGNSL